MKSAIQVEGIGKEYILGGHEAGQETFREMITDTISAPFRKLKQLGVNGGNQERFWALKDITFEIQPGEIVGIIGRNGAGKSTLLKILARITEPSVGQVISRGRIASLLEVGTGFHPELTGRENVFLNGAILGMKRNEIRKRFDEIVEFAEISKFLNTPVKRYSSGMYVRLAFAVAAHLEPEILIVDEVLAVGDVMFQKKCLGRMSEVAMTGRTVLFVSHNMGAINRLCARSLLLDSGTLQMDDSSSVVIQSYLGLGNRGGGEYQWPKRQKSNLFKVVPRSISTVSELNGVTGTFATSEKVQIEIELAILESIKDFALGLRITTQDGVILVHSAQLDINEISLSPGVWRTCCTIPASLLNYGTYSISVGADIPNREILFFHEAVLSFAVESVEAISGKYSPESWRGLLNPEAVHWTRWRNSSLCSDAKP